MTLTKICGGALLGMVGALSLLQDEINYRDDQIRKLTEYTAKLRAECPPTTVKLATQVNGEAWVVRCAGRGKVRTM